MRKQTKLLAQAAMLAALYTVLCHMQNLLLPGSGSLSLQLRAAEAMCILAYYTPAAVPGLTVGCLLFNLTSGAGLPADFLVGALATFLSVGAMRLLRRLPVPALLLPALFNGLLIGWELTVHIGGGFWVNAGYVAAGEAIVMLALGLPMHLAIGRQKLGLF